MIKGHLKGLLFQKKLCKNVLVEVHSGHLQRCSSANAALRKPGLWWGSSGTQHFFWGRSP